MSSPIDNLTNIISASPTAIAVLDTKMCYIAASQKWVDDYGLQGKEILGRSHYELFPEIGEEWKAIHKACLQGKAQRNPEDKFIRLNGTVQWLSWEVKPWTDNEGNIGGIIMYSADITSRITKNNELKRTLELFEETNEVARIGSWEIDLVRETVFWSSMIRKIHELDADFVPDYSNPWQFFKEGINKGILLSRMSEAVEKGISFDEELEIITRKGNILWVRIKGNPQVRDGRCVRVFGTIQDIQQVKIQSILQKDSEEKYKSIIENSLNAFFLVEPDGTLLEANRAAIEMFGYSLDELRRIGRSGIMDTSDPNFKRYLTLSEELGSARAELIGIRKNGDHFPNETSGVTFKDSNGVLRTSVSMVDISDRRNAEESLRLSEAQFRAVFEYSGTGIALAGLNGKFIRVNKSFCQIVGYSSNELLSHNFQEITHPDDLEKDISLIREMLDGKRQSYQLEKRYLHKNGSIIWVLLAGSLILDKDLKPSHRIIQIQNITDRKNFENAMHQEHELLSTLINNIPLNIFVKDLQSRYTLVNKTDVEYMGAENADGILGKDDYELYPMYLARIFFAEDQEVFKSGKAIINREKTITWADGSTRSFLTSKIPLMEDNGQVTGLLGIDYDISKIKDAEIALFESEQKFRKIFENIQDIFFQTDQDGIITEISPSIKKHSGYSRESAIGRPVTDFYYRIEDRAALIDILKENRSVNDYQVRLKSKAGEIKYVSLNAQLIIRNDKIIGTEGSMRDVTDRKIQEDTLKALNNDLNLLNDQKNKLLSVIAHDLRNPISGCAGLLEVVFMDVESTTKEELVEYMTMMQKSVRSAHELLEDLMEWAKIQFNSVDFNPVRINDIKKQVMHCLKKIDPIAEAKQIKISADLDEDLGISLDKYMFDAIIRNLVTNAVKFSNTGGEIKISAKEEKDGITFSVSDNGIGIASGDLVKLFGNDAGFTSYGTHGEKGTGMGLGLCRNFVEKHGGKIWVESTEGKGSTFYFTIPDQEVQV